MDLNKLQKEVWQNKVKKNFNTTNVNLEFNLLQTEIAEAFRAYLNKQKNLGEELADVAIYLFALAKMLKINLGDEIFKKIKKNKKREYRRVDGHLIRTKEG